MGHCDRVALHLQMLFLTWVSSCSLCRPCIPVDRHAVVMVMSNTTFSEQTPPALPQIVFEFHNTTPLHLNHLFLTLPIQNSILSLYHLSLQRFWSFTLVYRYSSPSLALIYHPIDDSTREKSPYDPLPDYLLLYSKPNLSRSHEKRKESLISTRGGRRVLALKFVAIADLSTIFSS